MQIVQAKPTVMEKTIKIERDIKNLYGKFFHKFKIDKKNGKFAKNSRWSILKFATYPLIGPKYAKDRKKRVLFIGLDIGKDENPNGDLIDFDTKRKRSAKSVAPHVYGMKVATSFLLENSLFKGRRIKKNETYRQTLRHIENLKKDFYPFDHFAMTNCYKFVIINQRTRFSSKSTRHISTDQEWNLLQEEIKILAPKFLVFESKSFINDPWSNLLLKEIIKKNKNVKVYVSAHPSYSKFHSHTKKYIETFKKIIKK